MMAVDIHHHMTKLSDFASGHRQTEEMVEQATLKLKGGSASWTSQDSVQQWVDSLADPECLSVIASSASSPTKGLESEGFLTVPGHDDDDLVLGAEAKYFGFGHSALISPRLSPLVPSDPSPGAVQIVEERSYVECGSHVHAGDAFQDDSENDGIFVIPGTPLYDIQPLDDLEPPYERPQCDRPSNELSAVADGIITEANSCSHKRKASSDTLQVVGIKSVPDVTMEAQDSHSGQRFAIDSGGKPPAMIHPRLLALREADSFATGESWTSSFDSPSSLAAALAPDPEEVLTSLGFATSSSVEDFVPLRFFKEPSAANGIDVQQIYNALMRECQQRDADFEIDGSVADSLLAKRFRSSSADLSISSVDNDLLVPARRVLYRSSSKEIPSIYFSSEDGDASRSQSPRSVATSQGASWQRLSTLEEVPEPHSRSNSVTGPFDRPFLIRQSNVEEFSVSSSGIPERYLLSSVAQGCLTGNESALPITRGSVDASGTSHADASSLSGCGQRQSLALTVVGSKDSSFEDQKREMDEQGVFDTARSLHVGPESYSRSNSAKSLRSVSSEATVVCNEEKNSLKMKLSDSPSDSFVPTINSEALRKISNDISSGDSPVCFMPIVDEKNSVTDSHKELANDLSLRLRANVAVDSHPCGADKLQKKLQTDKNCASVSAGGNKSSPVPAFVDITASNCSSENSDGLVSEKFANASLLDFFKSLTGKSGFKPFSRMNGGLHNISDRQNNSNDVCKIFVHPPSDDAVSDEQFGCSLSSPLQGCVPEREKPAGAIEVHGQPMNSNDVLCESSFRSNGTASDNLQSRVLSLLGLVNHQTLNESSASAFSTLVSGFKHGGLFLEQENCDSTPGARQGDSRKSKDLGHTASSDACFSEVPSRGTHQPDQNILCNIEPSCDDTGRNFRQAAFVQQQHDTQQSIGSPISSEGACSCGASLSRRKPAFAAPSRVSAGAFSLGLSFESSGFDEDGVSKCRQCALGHFSGVASNHSPEVSEGTCIVCARGSPRMLALKGLTPERRAAQTDADRQAFPASAVVFSHGHFEFLVQQITALRAELQVQKQVFLDRERDLRAYLDQRLGEVTHAGMCNPDLARKVEEIETLQGRLQDKDEEIGHLRVLLAESQRILSA